MTEHVYNPSTWEMENGGLGLKASLGYIVRLYLQKINNKLVKTKLLQTLDPRQQRRPSEMHTRTNTGEKKTTSPE